LSSHVLIAGLHLSNLSENAGFEQVAKFLPFDYVDAGWLPFQDAPFGTLKKRINLTLYELYLKRKIRQYKLVHYIFPELHLTFSQPTNRNIISVGTVHLPLDWLAPNARGITWRKEYTRESRKKAFMRFDALVTVTRDNVASLKEHFPDADVRFIPHGVHDNSGYLTKKNSRQDLQIITVGSNFRDFDLLENVVRHAQQNNKKWKFHLVGALKLAGRFKPYPAMTVHPYLLESEYLRMLSDCDVHLLPLTFATANNAILEAHSVGTPSLASELNSVKDYALSTTMLFTDLDGLITRLNELDGMSVEELNELKERTIRETPAFFWTNIASAFETYYQQLLRNRKTT
jgi:glycosyltransferase involved in cell wall biosynthesis